MNSVPIIHFLGIDGDIFYTATRSVKHGRTHTVTTVMSNNCWQTLLTVTNRVANFLKLKYGTCSGEGEVGVGCFGLVGWGLIMRVDHIYIYIYMCVCVCVCVFVNTMYEKAYFSIKATVLNSSPRAPALHILHGSLC